MKTTFYCILCIILLCQGCKPNNNTGSYKGKPYSDDVYQEGAQLIPGRLQSEYYDLGGEGISFHDSDTVNSGSGNLNPADGSRLNEFRLKEAVDISYTKFRDPAIDNSPYNFTEPEKDQFYVGWTNPGEWTKYTVKVEEEADYKVGLMHTANQNGKVSLSVNDTDVTGPLSVPSTFVAADTINWRQWHHWNYIDSLTTVHLKKGLQVITIHTVETGQMNYDYFSFTKN